MTQAVSRGPESIQLMTQAAFQELIKNQLMTQLDSPGIDSHLHMTQSALCIFRFKSTHDSNEKHLILSRLMIRLWVIPMSGWYISISDRPVRYELEMYVGTNKVQVPVSTPDPNVDLVNSLLARSWKRPDACSICVRSPADLPVGRYLVVSLTDRSRKYEGGLTKYSSTGLSLRKSSRWALTNRHYTQTGSHWSLVLSSPKFIQYPQRPM